MTFTHVISLLSGIAFFLFGMNIMSTGLKRVAGPRVETYLWRLSSTPIKGFLLGTLVAAIIQSSSATSVMVVSFVNAGMMKLTQAVSIVLGSNVGTTMTGWLLTLSSAGDGDESVLSQIFSTTSLIGILAIVGIILYMFAGKSVSKNIGLIFMGLGTLLLSMSLISTAVGPLKESEAFTNLLTLFENPFLGILAGVLVAAILQSSSASVGILQALCVTGIMPLRVCLPLILGINVGAASPVMLSMLKGTRNGKRTAWSYLIGNICAVPIIYVIYLVLDLTVGLPFMDENATVISIAILNTSIRLIAAPFLLSGYKLLVKISYLLVPEKKEENEDMEEIDSLNDSLLNYTPAAIEKANSAALKMFEISKKNLLRSIRLITEFDKTKYQKVEAKEALVDKYEDKLNNFIVKMSKMELAPAQQAKVSELLNAIGDFERLSDHAVNLAEVALEISEKKVVFSAEAQKEVKMLTDAIIEILLLAERGFKDGDRDAVLHIEPLEEVVDMMCKMLKANHIERLQKNNCTILSGFVYSDLLSNLERVADHCSNIAFCVQHGSNINAEEHSYSETVVNSESFKKYFEEYRTKYFDSIS